MPVFAIDDGATVRPSVHRSRDRGVGRSPQERRSDRAECGHARRDIEPDGFRLTRVVRDWLLGRGPRPDGLSEVDGRADLRGFEDAELEATMRRAFEHAQN